MYHKIDHQEQYPEKYELTPLTNNYTEDECYQVYSKPKQTQTTIGLYLKKNDRKKTLQRNDCGTDLVVHHRPDPNERDKCLENRLAEFKGFWVDKPTVTAPLVYKLKEMYTVQLPKKDYSKAQGIFYRPDYMEQEYLTQLGNAGLLYPDEEISDSEEEIKPDMTMCLPLRKQRYKICDPCKTETEKKNKEAVKLRPEGDTEILLPFKKIPSGCQCNHFGEHLKQQTVPDNPYTDEVDMIRQHELDKYLRPFKNEFLNKNYKTNPPIFIPPDRSVMKRTFPEWFLSNL